jgi:LysR family transcriptional regulator, low CO2-responsive transcriptional regulator
MNGVIDSRQLLAFATLARLGSFTGAAKELFLTQSAVSHAIKALETELGVRLFDRLGKKAHLTQAGEQLLQHADRILVEMDQARQGLEQLQNWGHGRLRVGASSTACQYLLPNVLREFRQSFPTCTVKIQPGDGPALVEALRANQIDLAILLRPMGREELEFHDLFMDEMQFLVSPLHPWAQKGYVPRSTLHQETFILYSKTSYTFQLVSDYFAREGVTLQQFMELGNIEAIKELVKIGLGVAVLAPWVARKELAEQSLLAFPMGSRRLRRTWGIAHLRGRRLALAEETFVGLCHSVAESLLAAGEGTGAEEGGAESEKFAQ